MFQWSMNIMCILCKEMVLCYYVYIVKIFGTGCIMLWLCPQYLEAWMLCACYPSNDIPLLHTYVGQDQNEFVCFVPCHSQSIHRLSLVHPVLYCLNQPWLLTNLTERGPDGRGRELDWLSFKPPQMWCSSLYFEREATLTLHCILHLPVLRTDVPLDISEICNSFVHLSKYLFVPQILDSRNDVQYASS